MNNKVWVYKNIDKSITKSLIDRYGFTEICANVLQNRMDIAGGNADNLFKRVLYNLHNPFLLQDMDKAVTRIEIAVMRNEKITIYGDYDADGITSASILYMFLQENGADVDFYIPDRFSDGYGMTKAVINSLYAKGTKLIITVDNGIAAKEEVEYAMSLGMDVIVTDHHECPDNLPDCCAVINPKRKNSNYPFKELAGVGVVFKLITALNKGSLESIIKKYILITAIGTIADIVPLTDENRAIVIMGLKMVSCNHNPGVKALLESAAISDNPVVSDFAFGVIPRINAAGRIDNAGRCVKLFTSKDYAECRRIADYLNTLNSDRQEIEKSITEQAFKIIEDEQLYKDMVIVVYEKGWNHGVIGIVASKIAEKYYKPAFVITDDADGMAKGSARSVDGMDLYESLTYCSPLLAKYGGHSLAAGLSLNASNIDDFRLKINEYAHNLTNGNPFVQKINIDLSLTLDDINNNNISSLGILEPYGVGNPKPVFALTDVRVVDRQTLSDGKHLKLRVSNENGIIDVIGFRMGDYFNIIKENDLIDIAGNLDINNFRGVERPQIILKDIKRIRHI